MLKVRRLKRMGPLDENGVDIKIGSLFCQMNQLSVGPNKEQVWLESARWLKFVEVVEASGRWSKPHVATLSNLGLIQLRRLLADGVLMLDCHEKTFEDLIGTI